MNVFTFFVYSIRNKIPEVAAKYQSTNRGVIMERLLDCRLYRFSKKKNNGI